MSLIKTVDDILALKEDYEIEFKKALGKNKKGKLPTDFFETYSAMANTYGGYVFLGIEEIEKGVKLSGITDPYSIKKDLFDTLNNRQRISANILTDEHVTIHHFEDSYVIEIHIPQATRIQKPVYKGENPMHGSYFRQYEGDYRCSDEQVKNMLAEQIDDVRDDKVLPHYTIDDLDIQSLNAYRNIFKSHKPDHIWNAEPNYSFLQKIGAHKKDRETGLEGLTIAGLLMFGQENAILDYFPNYLLDYQEQPKVKTENRWIDRVTHDGTWSGNVFDFYRIVINKLITDLKVPFKLVEGRRVDDTILHEALRESLVNTIVHADYTLRSSILIVKRPDMFSFRNPGKMRIPLEVALKGGESDCRNRILHRMFSFIGYGERAGSGIPKILHSWREQNWAQPLLHEKNDPPQTLLELKTLNLLDQSVITELEGIYTSLDNLSKDELTLLATTLLDGGINHKRSLQLIDAHPSDVTKLLKSMTDKGLLDSSGVGRGTIYQIKYPSLKAGIHSDKAGILSDKAGILSDKAGILSDKAGILSNEEENEKPRAYYRIEEFNNVIPPHITKAIQQLEGKQKVKAEVLEAVVVEMCNGLYLAPSLIQSFTGKGRQRIKEIISSLTKQHKLQKLFEFPNHPKQAYTSSKNQPLTTNN